ncbi:MAG: RNA helicase [Bathelium mastoideum]|nr:MAG: RNA helicase [Bathelium mastoideum]
MLRTSQLSRRCILNHSRARFSSTKFAARQRLRGRPLRPSYRRPQQLVSSEPIEGDRLPSQLLEGIKSERARDRAKGRGVYRLPVNSPAFQAQFDGSMLDSMLNAVEADIKNSPLLEGLGLDPGSFQQSFFGYRQVMQDVFTGNHIGRSKKAKESRPPAFKSTSSKELLQETYEKRGHQAVLSSLKYGFYGHVASSRLSTSDLRHQSELADLRYPNEWFPATRTMHRTVHLHVGPTNSGKTYHALKRLEAADSGVYAGPLRLLAHEVYTRLNAKGKRCLLITGEEKRSPDETMSGSLSSCTVEMVPLNMTMDVAVIDEIQMIGNHERGWAWTQAFLGLKAKELHVCGEERSVPLIQELAASVGDKLEIHKYTRLSPLKVMGQSLNGKLKDLQKGDCIVSFSIMGIHALRREIQKITGRKVAIVYGSLPPETRAQQARLFNDPDNDYDFLVASDAIGMGLNLSIKRIIFETTSKKRGGGSTLAPLTVAEVKQIAGRAGRYRTAHQDTETRRSANEVTVSTDAQPNDPSQAQNDSAPSGDLKPIRSPVPEQSANVGYVTTLEKFDFQYLDNCMESPPEPLTSAGLFPPGPVVEQFAGYFPPGTPFSYILLRLHEIAKLHPRFHLCDLKDQLSVADAIQPVEGLTTMDRIIFCAAPVSCRSGEESEILLVRALARCVAQQRGGNLLDIEEIPLQVLDEKPSMTRNYLYKLERLHKGIILYLWLGYRFEGVFNTQRLALHVKGLVEAAIEKTLEQYAFSSQRRQQIRAQREQRLMQQLGSGLGPNSSEIGHDEEQGSAETDENAYIDTMQAESQQVTESYDSSSETDLDDSSGSYDSSLDLEATEPNQADADLKLDSSTEGQQDRHQDSVSIIDDHQHTDNDSSSLIPEEGVEPSNRAARRAVNHDRERQAPDVGEELDDGLEELSEAIFSPEEHFTGKSPDKLSTPKGSSDDKSYQSISISRIDDHDRYSTPNRVEGK